MKLRGWHIGLIAVTVIIGALSIKVATIMRSGGRLVQVSVSDSEVSEFREFAFNYRRVLLHRTPNPVPKPSDMMLAELEAEGFRPLLKLFRQDPHAVWNLHYNLDSPGPLITIQGAVACDAAAVSSLAVKAAKGLAKVHVDKNGYQLRGVTQAGGRQFSFYLFNTGAGTPGQYGLSFHLEPKPGTPRLTVEGLRREIPPGPGIPPGRNWR